jgi:hypothetical protein
LEKEGTSIKQKEENQMLKYKLHIQIFSGKVILELMITEGNKKKAEPILGPAFLKIII